MKFETSCFAFIILLGSSCFAKIQTDMLSPEELQLKPDRTLLRRFGFKCRIGTFMTLGCECPKYYYGPKCEIKACKNGGELETVIPKAYNTKQTIRQTCKCPNPEFISGEHCENVRCANDGVLKTDDKCDCTGFYGGEFCEKIVIPVSDKFVMICLFVFVALACSPLLFHQIRKNRRKTANRCPPSGGQQLLVSSGEPSQNRPAHRSSSSEDSIFTERPVCPLSPNYADGFVQHVVRVNPNRTFSPIMTDRVQAPVGPPPTYYHAVSDTREDPPSYAEAAAVKNDS